MGVLIKHPSTKPPKSNKAPSVSHFFKKDTTSTLENCNIFPPSQTRPVILHESTK